MRTLGSLSLLACIGCVGQIDVDKDGVSSALQGAVALTAKAVSASEVDLSWTMSVTASSFAIKRGTSMSALSSLATSSTASFADKTVSAGTTYYYRVIATASNGVKYGSVITPVLVSSASTCGDGVCDDSETVASCPADCAANTNLGLTFAATAGTITAPFYVSNGAVLQDAEHTTVDATDGSAVYNFTVATAGGYTLNALVSAPNEGANSFYINIDEQPTDPTMIWDIPVGSGFQNETVAWRGNGTPDVDQFTPKMFTLSAGTHQLIVRGREGGTQVQSFTFVAQNTTAPPVPGSPSDGGVAPGSPMSCTPNCTSRQCGDDGCGGQCGTCAAGLICSSNACIPTSGRTFYVDYQAGSDSSSGASKSTAWKRAPDMTGFAGSYSHQAGDRIIFKGGVTWPSSTLPLNVSHSGTASAQDYYGVDSSWYAGASWQRPIFDGGGNLTTLILMATWSQPLTGTYITVDGIELTNTVLDSTSGDGGIISMYGEGYIVLNNLYVHNWDVPGSLTWQYAIYAHNGYAPSKVGPVTVQNSRIDDGDGCRSHPGVGCGGSLWGIDDVLNNEIAYSAEALVHGGEQVIGNHVHNILHPLGAPTVHGNVLYVDRGVCYIRGNYIHDNANEAGQIYACSAGTVYAYDNIIANATGNPYIEVDPEDHAVDAVYVWNNTFIIPAGETSVRGAVPRSYGVGQVVVQNNQIITPSGGGAFDSSGVATFTQDHNLWETPQAAASAGYSLTNLFAPTSASAPTVNIGTPLSCTSCPSFMQDRDGVTRPQGGAWDVGAYEYAP